MTNYFTTLTLNWKRRFKSQIMLNFIVNYLRRQVFIIRHGTSPFNIPRHSTIIMKHKGIQGVDNPQNKKKRKRTNIQTLNEKQTHKQTTTISNQKTMHNTTFPGSGAKNLLDVNAKVQNKD